MAQGGRGALGQGADDRTPPRARGVASDQRGRLGTQRRDIARVGAKAVELRSTLPPRWARAWHRNADRDLARRGAREQRQRPAGRRSAARRRLDVRRRRAVDRGEIPNPLLIVMYNNRAYYNDWNHQ